MSGTSFEFSGKISGLAFTPFKTESTVAPKKQTAVFQQPSLTEPHTKKPLIPMKVSARLMDCEEMAILKPRPSEGMMVD